MTICDKADSSRTGRERIIRMRELASRLTLSSSYIYSMIKSGRFPRPLPLVPGGRAKGWTESDLSQWLAGRQKFRNPKQTVSEFSTPAETGFANERGDHRHE
jgi:prophage regulatory protein